MLHRRGLYNSSSDLQIHSGDDPLPIAGTQGIPEHHSHEIGVFSKNVQQFVDRNVAEITIMD